MKKALAPYLATFCNYFLHRFFKGFIVFIANTGCPKFSKGINAKANFLIIILVYTITTLKREGKCGKLTKHLKVLS